MLVATLILAGSPPARAAVLWTLTATPLSVTTGTSTTFILTASLTLLGDVRCIRVDVPANFEVNGAEVTGSNAGGSWTQSVAGSTVEVFAESGGDRLRTVGQYVTFTIDATAISAGSLAWNATAYDGQDCQGGGSLLGVPPIVLVTGPAVTPAPLPTPIAAPTNVPIPTLNPVVPVMPTLTPKPTPEPPAAAASTPRPAPVVTEPSGPRPPGAQPNQGPTRPPAGEPASSAATATPSSTPVPAVARPPGAAPVGTERQDRVGPTAELVLAQPAVDGDVGEAAPVPVELGALGWLASADVWLVPGMLLGVPGLLVIAFVLLQGAGALAWIPAIRRLGRGDDRRPATV